MPRTVRGTRRTAGAAAVLTVLSLAATACGSDPQPAAAPPPAAASTGGKPAVKLPESLQDLKNLKVEDLAAWAEEHGFKPESLQDYWDKAKMLAAQGVRPKDANIAEARTPTRDQVVFPPAIPAKAQPHPYNANTAVVGKIFAEVNKNTYSECSGTVVADPRHPGKSNLVWTAAHCVHGGKGADWLKKTSFVPAFNRPGAPAGRKDVPFDQLAPHGAWTVEDMYVMPQWTQEGGEKGSGASQYDFAVLRVRNERGGGGKSLEESVGGAVPIWFNAPADRLTAFSSYGYPADAPFDGMELEHCDSTVKPVPYVYDPARPPMLAMGCTMTSGSSGGGWFGARDGKPALVSNTSVGNSTNTMLAGPTLGDEARKMFEYFSAKR
ncbi:trypsin-like serine peptidase [Kitasatospora camelliae]|uniref:V8-like Glu-specific endopeptidase n=1 Tax=Kitasatospora camelliae TaxID=3156397 RepID=A0AAU8K0N5_9ACTN